MRVASPEYVAGFERGFRPIGDWSTTTGRSARTCDRGAADRVAALERGDEHVANERRLPRAGGAGDDGEAARPESRSRSRAGSGGARPGRRSTRRSPRRRRAGGPAGCGNVRPDGVVARQSAAGVPWKTTRPPSCPAPGPSSTTSSAAATAARSCSTIRTGPRSRASCSSTRPTWPGSSPIVGSSSTWTTFSTRFVSRTASRSRCASPRESVGDERSSAR